MVKFEEIAMCVCWVIISVKRIGRWRGGSCVVTQKGFMIGTGEEGVSSVSELNVVA